MLFATLRLIMVIIFCKIVLRSNFKKPSYGADTILLQGHAVTLTFKVATQILLKTRRLNVVFIFVIFLSDFK